MTQLLEEPLTELNESPPQPRLRVASPRFLFVDGLRGIAACCVMMFHFIASGSFYPLFQRRLPTAFYVAGFGYLGVDIFFVISGFVVAFSIRNQCITAKFIGNFIVRRSLRLDPPLLVTIALTLLLLWFYNGYLHQHYTPMPTIGQTLANIFYLTGIFKIQPMLPIFWTLCLEVQFYLLFVLALWMGGSSSGEPNWRSGAILGGLGLVSAAIVGGWLRSFDGWFINDWNLFLLGALLWWTIDRKLPAGWLIGYAGLMMAASIHTHSWNSWTGLLTMAGIGVTAMFGKLETALGYRPLQFLGRISYSLYLLHALIGPQIDGYVSWHFRDSLTAAILSVIVAIGVSIAAAWLMHRYVEQPGIWLGKRFRARS